MNAVLYIHGKGGSAAECDRYKPLFDGCFVTGLDYATFTPWETGAEIKQAVTALKERYSEITLIANSIGAFFAMNADICGDITHAFFISPVVDMEKLITNMMSWASVTEEQLCEKGVVKTEFGEDLSWEYLCYVREHPISWTVPTDILYGSLDSLIAFDDVEAFAHAHSADLTVMQGGEHWFHTEEQLAFVDEWIKSKNTASQ